MGWNAVQVVRPHPLLAHVVPGDEFYFVHAYYPVPKDAGMVRAVADYEGRFCCALGVGNYFATQFHPGEKRPRRSAPDRELCALGRQRCLANA